MGCPPRRSREVFKKEHMDKLKLSWAGDLESVKRLRE
jgi:hypothetical protein